MASNISTYIANKFIDEMTGKTEYTKPTCYVAAGTAAPGDDGATAAEPSGNGYARVATAGGDWNAASSRATTNANDITFPTASGSWGTITHVYLYDAATDGNFLGWAALDSSEAISTNQILTISASDITIQFTASA